MAIPQMAEMINRVDINSLFAIFENKASLIVVLKLEASKQIFD